MKNIAEHKRMANHVAILGFAEPCPSYNEEMAFMMGSSLAREGHIVTAGNLTSTFHSAFMGAKSEQGNTLAVLENQMQLKQSNYCDVVMSVSDTNQKHRMLAEMCSAAIMIGGGPGTKHIETEFLKRKKPVVALCGTGGIVRNELNNKTMRAQSVEETLELLH